jgi:hypothetical protein
MKNTVNGIENPELASKLAKDAIQKVISEDVGEGEALVTPKVSLPPNDEVELLAGTYNPFTKETITTATVRELNGADEEALSKISDFGKGLLAILQRGVVSVGDQPASVELLDGLLSGDREYLIMKIRQVTFGNTLELQGECPFCDVDQSFIVDLTEDIKLTRLEDVSSSRGIDVECKIGIVSIDFPDGSVQKKIINSSGKTVAELDTILLQECISSVNGMPVLDTVNTAKKLGIQDRRTILKKLSKVNPGPNLDTVTKTCSSCQKEVPTPLTLADLFRLQ